LNQSFAHHALFICAVYCLVALAALAASGAVMAQATLYGILDVGYFNKQASNGDGAMRWKQNGIGEGGQSSGRFGFRGTEDLGGGLTASFVTEHAILATSQNGLQLRNGTTGVQYEGLSATDSANLGVGGLGAYTSGTNRQTYVGLAGKDWGSVRVGYQYTAFYEVSTLGGYTNTSEGAIGGAIGHLWGQAVSGGTRGNGIRYESPRMNNFGVSLQMGSGTGRESTEFGASTTNTADGQVLNKQARTSIKIDYINGPLSLVYANTRQDNQLGATVAGTTGGAVNFTGSIGSTTNRAAVTAQTNSNVANQFAASYDFKVVKIGLTVNRIARNVSAADSTGTAAALSAVGDYNLDSNAVSFNMPMGKLSINGGMSTANASSAGTTHADWASRQLGVRYDLSKRTNIYGFMGTSTNNATAAQATGVLKEMTGTVVGVRHDF
jgi:predicted porin